MENNNQADILAAILTKRDYRLVKTVVDYVIKHPGTLENKLSDADWARLNVFLASMND